MQTDLEQRLRDELHREAERARLENPDAPTGSDTPQLLATEHATRTRWLVAGAAATIVVAVSGIAAIQHQRSDVSRSETVDTSPVTQPVLPPPDPRVSSTELSEPAATQDSTPSESSGPTIAQSTAVPTPLFAALVPNSATTLPSAPIAGRVAPAAVWTGTEMVLWGGSELLAPFGEASISDGAALNLATGTWRSLSPAPVEGRSYPGVAWTGSEMIVWGGSDGGNTVVDGAAYNPATDTWRILPPAPIESAMKSSALWTGTEVLFLGGMRSVNNGSGSQSIRDAAAYNPATNSWRRLADLPGDSLPPYPQAVWTGNVVLSAVRTENEADPLGSGTTQIASYDPTTDDWQTMDADSASSFLVGIPDEDGISRTVLAMSPEADIPIDLLDADGNSIGQLAGRPADLEGTGNYGAPVWVGSEALFWMGGAEGWALNPATQVWRTFPAGDLVSRVDGAVLSTGDLMLTWGGFVSQAPNNTEGDDGIVYRGVAPES